MSGEADLRLEKLAARYVLPRQAEWQKLLNHFRFSEGFSLLVLLVLDMDGADLCRRELEKQLQQEGKKVFAIEIPTPEELRRLSSRLLVTQPPSNAGCVWIAAVEPDYGKAYREWRNASELTLARLNSHRNKIRRQFNLPLVFVGAPWLQEVMREIAPDLWSVRTLVIRIEPLPPSATANPPSEPTRFDFKNEGGGADPVFALNEAEKLRGLPGKELALARLLSRAGEGFASRDDWPAAQTAYVEALELNQRAGASPDLLLANFNQVAIASAITGHYRDSVAYLEKALTITRQIRDRRSEGSVLGNLGSSLRNLGNIQKALECTEQSLVIAREVGDRRDEANNLMRLANIHNSTGDIPKRIEFNETALVIAREIGDRELEGASLNSLGAAYKNLGDIGKAVELHEQALGIARHLGNRREEVGALGNLGLDYFLSGDWNKAIELFEQALPITKKIGAKSSEGLLLFNYALALASLKNLPRAITLGEASLQILKAVESPVAGGVEAQLASWRTGLTP